MSNRIEAPLSGLRVLDLSRVLAGPVCCQILGDLGADVVKVERPGTGDDTRAWGPPFVQGDGPSAYYLSANRNKRSLALDLDNPAARPLLASLVQAADVLIENFLPKDLEKFGLTPQRLETLNPQLVSCSISGYGRTGPLANVPGYDLIVQATSGLMSITGEAHGPPLKVGVAITDIITGLYAAIAALAGLRQRDNSQLGTNFDLSLFDCTMASLVNVVQGALVSGERPRRYGNAHPHIVPYQAFATRDGHLVLGVGNDRQWQRFCQCANQPAWATDPRFATNPARVQHRDVLIPLIENLFSQFTTHEWEQRLENTGVPHAPVLGVDQALASPQFKSRNMVAEIRDDAGLEYPLLATPIHWPGRNPQSIQPPPAVGQHTTEILQDWLAKTAAEIAQLRKQGAIS